MHGYPGLRCLALVLSASFPACVLASPPAGSHLPLGPGARWSYTRTTHSGEAPAITITQRFLGILSAPSKALNVGELRSRTGKWDGYEYWSQQPDGIYHHDNALLGGMAGVSNRRQLILKLPAEVGSSWEFEEVHMPQTMGDGPPLDPEDYRTKYVAMVEALDDEVVVPAGRYTATRVRITQASARWGRSAVIYWFAKDVGLVKKQWLDGDGEPRSLQVLDAFTPPVAKAAETRKELQAVLGSTSIALEHSFLVAGHASRFHLASVDGEVRFARVCEGKVTSFDPEDPVSWNAFFEDEEWPVSGEFFAGRGGEFVQMCAYLVAAAHGADLALTPVSRLASGPRSERSRLDYHLEAGGQWKVDVHATFESHRVVELEVQFHD